MMMNPLARATDQLQKQAADSLRIVFPEGEDERIVTAAARIASSHSALRPVLLGARDRIEARATSVGVSLERIDVVDPESSDLAPALAQAYAVGRAGTAAGIAARAIRKPLFFGGMMVATGAAHAMIAGATCPTARVIEAAMLTTGLQPGVSAPSSFFIMQASGRAFVFADCAVNIAPDIETLAAIGVASAQSCRELLGETPRVAFLSFSTHGSAGHELARKARAATLRAQELSPEVYFDGELQADAALDPRVASLKVKERGSVAGQANVLVFPDLNAANIGYKLVQYIGGATALGPFLQGFAAPVSDLSRGASVDDIVGTAILTSARAIL